MSNKSFGLNKERELKKIFLNKGALEVVRARGSFGKFDIIVFWKDIVELVSVKATKRKYYSEVGECKKISKVQVPKGVYKSLYVYYAPNKERNFKGWKCVPVK